MSGKPRVIKDFDKLDKHIKEQIKLTYPYGFSECLITFTDKDGHFISALPFETDERYYMIKMSSSEAEQIIEEDDDYNEKGTLKQSAKVSYQEKHADVNYMQNAFTDEEAKED